jgi:hypothetical protein
MGIVGTGNNLALSSGYVTPSAGAGVVGNGTKLGVAGYATTEVKTNGGNSQTANGTNASAGGYFEVDNGGTIINWAYVGVQDNAGTLRKIIGNGTVNTIVKDTKDKLVALSCPEAPEDLFQDYGSGQLAGGRVHISIDSIMSKNIIVNDQHPLRVFIQLRGDCKGTYVTNEDQYGFDVIELDGGHSNAKFFWSLTANRADEVLPNGQISRYSAERYAPAPGPQPHEIKKAVSIQGPQSKMANPEMEK